MISQSDQASVARFGGKAASLLKWVNELPEPWEMPLFWAIPVEDFTDWLERNGVLQKIESCLDALNCGDVSEQVENISRLLSECRNPVVDPAELAKRAGRGPYAVRSSATVEDTTSQSFAGLFVSELNVDGAELSGAVANVYKSAFTRSVVEYCLANDIEPATIKMGVVVQAMIPNGRFGVAFKSHREATGPIEIIEAALNDPEGVTAGTAPIDTYASGTVRRSYPAYLNSTMLFAHERDRIGKLLESFISDSVDVEFVLTSTRSFVLQVRPLTRSIAVSATDGFAGFGIGGGIAEGTVRVWPCEVHNVKSEDILVASEIEISDVDIIRKAAGAIVEVGGLTGHVAVLAREIGMPAIVGAQGIGALVSDGDPLRLDGDTGQITFLNRPGLQLTRPARRRLFNLRARRIVGSGRAAALTTDEGSFEVVHHDLRPDALITLVDALGPDRNVPLIEGSQDIWYAYGHLTDMARFDTRLRELETAGLAVLKSGGVSGLLPTIKAIVSRGTAFLDSNPPSELKPNSSDYVGWRYVSSGLGFAYWRLMQALLFSESEQHLVDDQGTLSDAAQADILVAIQNASENVHFGEKAIAKFQEAEHHVEQLRYLNLQDYELVSDLINASSFRDIVDRVVRMIPQTSVS